MTKQNESAAVKIMKKYDVSVEEGERGFSVTTNKYITFYDFLREVETFLLKKGYHGFSGWRGLGKEHMEEIGCFYHSGKPEEGFHFYDKFIGKIKSRTYFYCELGKLYRLKEQSLKGNNPSTIKEVFADKDMKEIEFRIDNLRDDKTRKAVKTLFKKLKQKFGVKP